MKWSITQLRKHQNEPLHFETTMSFPHLIKNLDLIDLSPINVSGTLTTKTTEVFADISVTGHFVMNDARTLAPVEVPIQIESLEIFDMNDIDYNDDDNRHEILNGMIDLKPVVEELVVLEKPVRAIDESSELSMTKGRDWEVVDEDQYEEDDTPKIDPRFAKLKDLL